MNSKTKLLSTYHILSSYMFGFYPFSMTAIAMREREPMVSQCTTLEDPTGHMVESLGLVGSTQRSSDYRQQ